MLNEISNETITNDLGRLCERFTLDTFKLRSWIQPLMMLIFIPLASELCQYAVACNNNLSRSIKKRLLKGGSMKAIMATAQLLMTMVHAVL